VHLVEDTRQLEREERVSARALVNAQQRLPGEGPPDTVTQESVDCADAERSDWKPLDTVRGKRSLELCRLRAVDATTCEEEAHAFPAEPP
jgi:hypothetical protein